MPITISGFFILPNDKNPPSSPKLPAIKADIGGLDNTSGQPSDKPFATGVTVLIDTGTNVSVVDEQILQDASVKQVGELNSVKTGDRSTSKIYGVYFNLGYGIKYSANVSGATLLKSNRSYSAILGMDFIRNFSLTIDFEANIVNLNRR
jgi:hypothetical protein